MKLIQLSSYFLLTIFSSCINDDKINNANEKLSVQDELNSGPKEKQAIIVPGEKKKHLNINILLDLSDRIDPKKNPKQPDQKQRDISAIMVLCQAFKNNVNSFNAFKTQAKIKVFFHPEPYDTAIARIANDLNVLCKAGSYPEAAKYNKLLYQKIDSKFTNGLNKIYDLATKSGQYPGSNIFRFMKDEIKNCVEDTNLFRNILVIFTDGYVYDQNEKYHQRNRYSYIEKSYDHFSRFRKHGLMTVEFDKNDYGFMKANDGLSSIEVLVLELSPPKESPIDIDILKKYWNKWLNEMGVVKKSINPTGQPVYTEQYITNFLSN